MIKIEEKKTKKLQRIKKSYQKQKIYKKKIKNHTQKTIYYR